MKALIWCVLAAIPLAAQDRDFLTTIEVAQIREAQEPNARITLYAKFAKDRVEMIKNFLSKEKTGRSVMVHDALEDYVKIIDAIDAVTDEALGKKGDLKVGLKAVADMEKETLPILEKLRDTHPKDEERYAFVLRNAIETTNDSLELAMEDLGKRTNAVEAKQEREKKALKEAMTPTEREGAAATEKKAAEAKAEEEKKPVKKPPTLMRPGEKAGEKKQ
jgi:hypothetical protein